MESGQSGRDRLEREQYVETIGAKFGAYLSKKMSFDQKAEFDIRERFKHKRVFTARGMIKYQGVVETRKHEIAKRKEMDFYHTKEV